jgi:hypothetical protein
MTMLSHFREVFQETMTVQYQYFMKIQCVDIYGDCQDAPARDDRTTGASDNTQCNGCSKKFCLVSRNRNGEVES